jgi:3-hydroxyisobutyrate dehydrogenase
MRAGFIGTGVMGLSMAGHLLKAGYPLCVHNRTRSKAEPLLEAGASWCGDVPSLARQCDVVITMLGYPADVEAVCLGEQGIIRHARPGTLLVDMTTSSPVLARAIAKAAEQAGCAALDAPVSGGDVGAREARLSIMVGGDSDAYERAGPLFSRIGRPVVHHGPAGSGQHCKMANQIAIAAGMLGVCEAMAYADKAGLDPWRVLDSISTGAAGSWSLSNLAPRMLKGDFAPGFYVKHFIKDLKIALDSAAELGLATPALEKALELYQRLAGAGHADEGTQALFRLYRG